MVSRRHKSVLRMSVSAHRLAYGVSAAALVISVAGTAQAQSTDETSYSGIAEIIVTAQKREQSVQDVPVAVTALGADTLQVNRVVSVMDLNGLAPGLVSRANAGSLGSASFSMRGVFASASQPSSDRQIGTYVDGVYIGSTRGSVFDLPDVQRIEVLRGPQGTLFGRNATAGAVSVVTRDPNGELGLRQEITVGNYAQLRTRTTVSSRQMGIFSAYVTFVHDERRGDVRNLGAGTVFDRSSPFHNIGQTRSPKYLGSRNFENIFAAIKIAPNDDLSLVYKFDRSKGTNTPEARVTTVLNPNDFVGGLLTGLIAAQPAGGGRFGPVTIINDNQRPKAANNAWTMPGFLKASGHNATIQWQASDSLSFRNITAYRETAAYGPSTIMGLNGIEYTAAAKAFFTAPRAFLGGASYAQALRANSEVPLGSHFSAYEGNSYGKQWQFSNETQLNYQSQLVTLTVGALYFRSKELSSGLPGMAPNFAFSPTPQLLPLGNVQEARAKTISLAGYAQGEFHVTPQIDIVAGGRVTKDKKSGSLTFGGTYTGTDRTNGTISGAAVTPWAFKKTKPTYSIGVNFKPNEDILLYAKYSTGFLSGGAVGPFEFAPETVKSGEIGLKSEFFDRRVRVNLAVWKADYDHSQSSQGGQAVGQPQLGVVVIDNGPLHAKGFELEVTAAPAAGLTVGGQLGYTDGKLLSPNPVVAQGRPYVWSGNVKWTGAVNAQYVTQPVWGEATGFFRIDANYQGKMRSLPFDDLPTVNPLFVPYKFMDARWIVNGRVALRNVVVGPAKAEIALWARNLFDNKDAIYPLSFGNIQLNASFQQARTYGIDLIFEL